MDFVNHINIGDEFSGIYIVDSAVERISSSGSKYLELYIRDKSGSRKVLASRGYPTTLKSGCFVSVSGRCTSYKDAPSLWANEISEVSKPDDLSNYVSSFQEKDVKDAWERIESEVNEISRWSESHDDFRAVAVAVEEVFSNAVLQRDKFMAPSGMRQHYGKVGGYVMETHDLLELSLSSARLHGLTEREVMFLKSIALVCRCGCVFAYRFMNGVPSTTFQGEMLGEGPLAFMLVNKALQIARSKANEKGYTCSESAIARFLHGVLVACMAIPPKTKEAIVLHGIVESHVKTIDCFDFIESDSQNGRFTAFDSQHGRRYLKGE